MTKSDDNFSVGGFLLLMLGLGVGLWAGHTLKDHYEERNWRTIEATVTAARADMTGWTVNGRTTVGWVTSLRLKYSAGGAEYAASEVSHSTDWPAIRVRLSRFSVGSKHTILYDPNAPYKFDLRIPSRRELTLKAVLAGAGLIMAVAGLARIGIGMAKARPSRVTGSSLGRGL